MLITNMENLSQFYQLRHMTEPCIVKYMACSVQTQQYEPGFDTIKSVTSRDPPGDAARPPGDSTPCSAGFRLSSYL